MQTQTLTYEKYKEVEKLNEPTILTGDPTLDNWWSREDGAVIGSSIFVTGTSGAGKTTLAINLMKLLEKYITFLYSREMHRSAVKDQTKDVGLDHDNAFIADKETCPNANHFFQALDEIKPQFIIIDSLQGVCDEDYTHITKKDGLRYVQFIKELQDWIRKNKAVLFVIGHNNKEGEFRGDNSIMQYIDAHMDLVHHKKEDYRTISWNQKNRKGPLDMLYYTINDDCTLSFYTKEEWEYMKGDKDLCDHIDTLIDNFVLPLKKHANYPQFWQEFKPKWDQLEKDSSLSRIEFYTQLLKEIDFLTKKHELV